MTADLRVKQDTRSARIDRERQFSHCIATCNSCDSLVCNDTCFLVPPLKCLCLSVCVPKLQREKYTTVLSSQFSGLS